MNERLRQLEHQCWEVRQYNPPWFNATKFAELIVRECVGIADEYDGVGSTIVSRIKKHFGVEE
jgi:hypothetical protein